MSMANPQLPDVSSPYGAPMGRREHRPEKIEGKCRCFRLRFVDGCYDEGGAYWGAPANVYCATDYEGDYREFTRASSRAEAKAWFKSKHPEIRWVN